MSDLTALDGRPEKPKDRYEEIMVAQEGLASGETLELSVDHDSKCMYYSLKATRGVDAVSFEYLEDGPETWRVHFRKP